MIVGPQGRGPTIQTGEPMNEWQEYSEDLNSICMEAFGDQVSFSPQSGGGPFSIFGVFDKETELLMGDPQVVSYAPTLGVNLSDLPVEPSQGDQFTIGDETYELDYIDADSGGGAILVLRSP